MVVRDERLAVKRISSGNRRLSISIGGIRCAVFSHDTGFLDLLRTRYQGFESPGNAVYEILIKLVPIEK